MFEKLFCYLEILKGWFLKMGDFLWHKISDSERVKIERDAKNLILEFGDALEKLPKRSDVNVERDSDSREEGSGEKCDADFRDKMLGNAPKVKEDCIVAEKGSWTQ